MAIVKMDRIEIYGLNRDRKKVLEHLHRLELVEFTESPDGLGKKETEQYISQFDSYIAAAGEAISILNDYAGEKSGFFSKRQPIDMNRYSMDTEEVNRVDGYIRRVIKNRSSIKTNEEAIGRIAAKKEVLMPYINLDVPMRTSSTKKTSIKVGTVEGNWTEERLYKAFLELEGVYIEIIKATKNKTYIWVVYEKAEEEKAKAAFAEIGFVEPGFSLSKHTPSRKIEILETARLDLISENEAYKKDIGVCVEFLGDIKLFYDHLVMRRDKYRALSKVGLTESAFVITGYLPRKLSAKVKAELEERYEVYAEITEPPSDEEVPVAFSNNAFTSPVEGITSDYSMPSANDIDPNPIMAVFYYLFFGMMFSDAGYGLIMVIACGLLGFGKFIEKQKRRAYKMFFYCGISTVFWGVMYGSFFGDMIATASRTFGSGKLAFTPILLDPVAKPLELLIISVAFGLIHILTALVIRFYVLWRSGERLAAVFDQGFWILFWAGVAVMVSGMALGAELTANIGIGMLIASVAGLILTQGRQNKKLLGKLFGGVLSLYDVTSYVGDLLSYSRLMALGLATGVIASVVNVLASLGGGGVIGIITFVVISVFGHSLNFAINMLGAYVHTNRLQYVEFYQKFYEGGGRKFKPLSMNTKYYSFEKQKERGN